jgi:hypothetical protein
MPAMRRSNCMILGAGYLPFAFASIDPKASSTELSSGYSREFTEGDGVSCLFGGLVIGLSDLAAKRRIAH